MTVRLSLQTCRGVLICAASLLSVTTASAQEQIEYYGTDALGSIRVVFDAGGVVKGRMDFVPFGDPLQPGAGIGDRVFAELSFDPETDSDYAQVRFYSSRTGRLTRPDPMYAGLISPQKWNRYAYALNAPLVFSDPDGLEQKRDFNLCTPDIVKLNPDDWHCQGRGGGLIISALPTGTVLPPILGPPTGHNGNAPRGGNGNRRGNEGGRSDITTVVGHDPNAGCDPLSLGGCAPGTPIAGDIADVVAGIWDSMLAIGSGKSCYQEFLRNAVGNLAMPGAPSAASLGEPVANYLSATSFNAALGYAATQGNVMGGTGLLFPFKSSTFRGMIAHSRSLAARGAFWLAIDGAVLEALGSEVEASQSGQCR